MKQHLRNGKILAAALGAACAGNSGQSAASTIVAPVTAYTTSVFTSSSGNNYSINNTINQAGLSLGYVSGVTDFDSYLAGKPKHTSNASGNEWFSEDFSKASQNLSSQNRSQALQGGKTNSSLSRQNQNTRDFGKASGKSSAGKASEKVKPPKSTTSSASGSSGAITSTPIVSITYGFSELTSINGFALWNDEYAGIGTTQLLSSIDGITYSLLSETPIAPTPSKFAPKGKVFPYLAQVFPFDLTTMLFFQLLIYDCPKPAANRESYRGCGIGEVAFSAVPRGPSEPAPVPLPVTLPLLGSAFGFIVWLGRRQQKSK